LYFNENSSWISAKKRSWTHADLDLGLGYEAWGSSEPTLTAGRSVAAMMEGDVIKLHSKHVYNRYNVVCMTDKLGDF
jgi:hypothetical protein